MVNLKERVKSAVNFGKKYWNEPAEGNYVPYKETASLGMGGLGLQWSIVLANTIVLNASSFLIGASIGLKPFDLQIMLIVANIIGIPITLFRGWYFDNHNMKGGKFIPFLLRCSFPVVLFSAVFVWLPFEGWDYITKAVITEIFYVIIQFFLLFYNDSFASLQQVITPNSQERVTVMSISQIIWSLAPTVTGIVIPTLAGLTWGLNNIKTYRVIYPAFTLIGLVFSTVFFKKVKERIILPKKKITHIRVSDAVREVAKNKYFWIICIATWIGFLESAYTVILGWSFVYAHNGEKAALLGVANTVIGNASLWGMLFAPFAIKKLGKRNLLILGNLCNVILFATLYPIFENLFAICVIWFLNNFLTTVNNICIPNITADMHDYHQWKTGVRVDGLFAPLTLIGTVLGFFTGLVMPYIYEKMGLQDNYDVLYNDALRNNLFRIIIICSIIGAVLNLIPYFFYDLTESKHKGYVYVLKIRAMFEDYGNNELDEKELVTAMDIIHTANEIQGECKTKPDKSALRAARSMPKNTQEEKVQRKEAIKAAKNNIKKIKQRNDNIECMPIVIEELNKFSTKRYQYQLKAANLICKNDEVHLYENAKEELKKAKAMSSKTKEEKEIRSDAIKLARMKIGASKLIEKYGIENITVPDENEKEKIQTRDIHTLREEMNAKRDLKNFMKRESIFRRSAAPYEWAKNLIIQAENYTHLDDIEKLYAKVKINQNNEMITS